jgi:hypothetical protein
MHIFYGIDTLVGQLTKNFLCLIVAFGAVVSCNNTDPASRNLQESCSRLKESSEVSATSDGEIAPMSDEELARMSDEEKRMFSKALEDTKKLPELLLSFCELRSKNVLPGLGRGPGKIVATRARKEVRRVLEKAVAPATRERACEKLYWIRLEQDGRVIRYFFCDEDSEFSLISTYEKRDGGWSEIK